MTDIPHQRMRSVMVTGCVSWIHRLSAAACVPAERRTVSAPDRWRRLRRVLTALLSGGRAAKRRHLHFYSQTDGNYSCIKCTEAAAAWQLSKKQRLKLRRRTWRQIRLRFYSFVGACQENNDRPSAKLSFLTLRQNKKSCNHEIPYFYYRLFLTEIWFPVRVRAPLRIRWDRVSGLADGGRRTAGITDRNWDMP